MMKIKGIKQGKSIDLSDEPNIPDGQEAEIEIRLTQQMSNYEYMGFSAIAF